MNLNKMMKNNTGYDLKQWFIGAEGTRGVITRVVLRLRPLPALALRGDPGLSGHVGGTLPMRSKPGPLETDKSGRLDGGREIYAVDLSVFPKMPAQNPTFTAVANAMRVASDWADREAA